MTGRETTKAVVPSTVPTNPRGLATRISPTTAPAEGFDDVTCCPAAKAREPKESIKRAIVNEFDVLLIGNHLPSLEVTVSSWNLTGKIALPVRNAKVVPEGILISLIH